MFLVELRLSLLRSNVIFMQMTYCNLRMPENVAKSSLDSCEAAGQTSRETMSRNKTPDTNTLDSSIRSFVTTTPTQSPLSSRTTLATNKASSTTPRSPMSEPNYLSPRDGMTPFQRRLHLLDSALDAVTPSRPSDSARATRHTSINDCADYSNLA